MLTKSKNAPPRCKKNKTPKKRKRKNQYGHPQNVFTMNFGEKFLVIFFGGGYFVVLGLVAKLSI